MISFLCFIGGYLLAKIIYNTKQEAKSTTYEKLLETTIYKKARKRRAGVKKK